MQKPVFFITFVIISVLFCPCINADKPKLAIIPFKEVGSVTKGCGKELTGIVSAKLSGRYQIKERLDIGSIFKEKLLQQDTIIDTEEIKNLEKKLGADLLLLGQISKTTGDYSLFIRIVDLSGNIGFCKNLQSSGWEGLKEKLKTLIRYEFPVPVLFIINNKKIDKKNFVFQLAGKNGTYNVKNKANIPPGEYKINLQNKNYKLTASRINIKYNNQSQTLNLEIQTKSLAINITLKYLGAGGTGLFILALLLKLLRKKSKQKISKSFEWKEIVNLAKTNYNNCNSLLKQESLKKYTKDINQLKQNINTLLNKVEMVPVKERQNKFGQLKEGFEKIRERLLCINKDGNIKGNIDKASRAVNELTGLV